MRLTSSAVSFGLIALLSLFAEPIHSDEPAAKLDVNFEPSHPRVVETMLRMAGVGKDDVVYDLGCGDGRIAIMAARRFGARAVGIDISTQRIMEAREKAEHLEVSDRVKFIQSDIMEADIREATVVTLYLIERVNVKLRPRLLEQLKPGTRVVSHAFRMGKWRRDWSVKHRRSRTGWIYYWVIPSRVKGTWRWKTSLPDGRKSTGRLKLGQKFQRVTGRIRFPETRRRFSRIRNAVLTGRYLIFKTKTRYAGRRVHIEYWGVVQGDDIRGVQKWTDRRGRPIAAFKWHARRVSPGPKK